MSQQVNAKAVGLFSISAIALFVFGILVFGSGDWFKNQDRLEMVFKGSVKGLGAGSSITYRGVRVGEVESINISLYGYDINVRVIGLIVQQESDHELFKFESDRGVLFKKLIKQGVRAQLVQESLVTGRLQIQFEFFEGLDGYAPVSKSGYTVIPTVPSEIEMIGKTISSLAEKFGNLPVKEISNNLAAVAKGLNSVVNSDEVKSTMTNLSQGLFHLNSLLAELDSDKEEMTDEFIEASRALKNMANALSSTANNSEPLLKGAETSLKKLNELLAQSSKTLATYERLVQPGSEISVTLIQTLQSFDRASEQVRQLAETLQRNPESILTGKQR